MSNYLFISDAAKEVKVESHVLRYWEEELHLPIKRNELGHRYYTEEDVERFKQIKSMKERGLQLKAIKMILKDGKLDVLSTEDTGTNRAMRLNQGGEDDGFAQSELSKTEFFRREMAAAMESDGKMPQPGRGNGQTQQSGMGKKYRESRATEASGELAIDIISTKEKEPAVQESREDKSRRLQWLLQQLIRQTLQENNVELCREIRDSVVKELDYQFRMQEEREETRDRMMEERQEEHFKKMDELIRKKSRRLGKRKQEKVKKAQAVSGQADYNWKNGQEGAEWDENMQNAWGANGQENMDWEGGRQEITAKENGKKEKKGRKTIFGRSKNERAKAGKDGEGQLENSEVESAEVEEKKKRETF